MQSRFLRGRILIRGFVCWWIGVHSGPLSAAPFDRCAEELAAMALRSSRPFTDSTVELELPFGPRLLRMLTTTDGTLKPLLEGVSPPEWLKGKDPAGERWDSLTPAQQTDLLQHVGRQSALRQKRENENSLQLSELAYRAFFAPGGRAIPGLKVREKMQIEVPPGRSFEILGKTYGPGTHTIDLRGRFGAVEWMGPESLVQLGTNGLELHFRAGAKDGFTPSTVGGSVTDLLASLGMRTHYHMHIVTPLPSAEPLPGKTAAERRNLMIALSMKMIMEADLSFGGLALTEFGSPFVVRKSAGGAIEFGTHSGYTMGEMTRVLQRVAEGDPPGFQSNFKQGSVGVRGPALFRFSNRDGTPRWSLEVRALTGEHFATEKGREVTGKLLDAVHYKMEALATGKGVSAEEVAQIDRWLAAKPEGMALKDYMRLAWFNRYVSPMKGELLDPALLPKPVAEAMTPEARKALETCLEAFPSEEGGTVSPHLQLKMLFHNWRYSPMVYRHADATLREKVLGRIETAQAEAIRELARNADEQGWVDDPVVTRISQNFFRRSGLQAEIGLSLGSVSPSRLVHREP